MNLILGILLGTAVSAWLLYHTDYFSAFASMLALGGIFSWIAFVSKLLSDDLLKSIQRGFEAHFLARWWFTAALLVQLLLAAGFAATHGSLRIESVGESSERLVYFAENSFGRDFERLPAGGQLAKVVGTPLFGSSTLKAKVKGYPDREVTASWLHREELRAPSDFLRPVVLLRPSINLMGMNRQNLRIDVKKNGRLYGVTPFDGKALWLGCASDVEVPAFYQGLWRAELQNREDLLSFVLFPAVVAETPLEEGADMEVRILDERGSPWGRPKSFKVLPVRRIEDFPQVVRLDTPEQ